MILIVDYGAGNLKSVAKAVKFLGYEARVTSSPREVMEARAVILPGVGSAPQAMERLQSLGLLAPLRQVIEEGRPFMGICLGMQLLLSLSEEGNQPCLDVIPGIVKKLPPRLKVPHMGWNLVYQKIRHPLFEGVPNPAYFYFVHSYYPVPEDPSIVTGETFYGVTFASVLQCNNILATQFHPEKSGTLGLQLYRNFFRLFLD